jgi:hypothetical protein
VPSLEFEDKHPSATVPVPSIVMKFDLFSQVNLEPINLKLKLSWVKKIIKKRKIWCDLMIWLIRQDPVKNSIAIC